MERLLNIKEAAEFLNVSEMTVRRWTNQGLLNCYRVGARRARRFSPQDLLACLEVSPEKVAPAMIDLGIKDAAVPDGSHITHLSIEHNEALETAAGFVINGLKKNDTVCIVAPKDKTENLMNALGRNHTNTERFLESGRLHLSRGMDTPHRQMEYLMELASQSGRGFRVFGDMTWTKEKGWPPETLARFEEAVNQPPRPGGMLLFCQYPLGRFTGTEIMTAIETHTHHIYRGRIQENPYNGKVITKRRKK